ncbi:subtilisin-like protein [Lactarius quietus]|nr:subtilisin-like protein [Lactarius quietus]
MRCIQLSALFVLAAAPVGHLATTFATLWNNRRGKHAWKATPTDWVSLGNPPAGTTIDLHIALKPHRDNALIDTLNEVSNPGHPRYGAYLSREQVADLVAPHVETLELVNSWLKYHGISSSSVTRTHGGGWLTVPNVPVSQADDLLGASYQLYRYAAANETVTILRTVGYALPEVLHTHVQVVVPTTHFGYPHALQQTTLKRHRLKAAALENATSGVFGTMLSRRNNEDEYVDPSFLASLYGTRLYEPAATDRNKLGIVGFNNQYPSKMDLKAFMDEFRDDAIDATFTVVPVNGGKDNPSNPGSEANSNVQYAASMSYPTSLVFYSTGGQGEMYEDGEPAPGDAFLEWLKYIIDLPKIPQTITFSYGIDELGLPPEYARILCKMFMQLGARGVSVLFATGNGGVGRGDCKDESGRVQFNPTFPSSCPWVTSVGGTTGFPEVAAKISQGGFSLIFPRPPYQGAAVKPFLEQLGSEYSGLYNPGGRGVPDISAQALNYVIFKKGAGIIVDGTSCAVPVRLSLVVAGIISLLNDYQLSQGKPALGFLNPRLYLNPAGFNDITSGNNPGCKTEGFTATIGWDPVCTTKHPSLH